MPGFVDNPYRYMANADAVVMTSLYEGFCNVLIEAMACGAPVISTDHETGAREILAPDTDYRMKVRDRGEKAEYGILVPVCEGEIGRSDDMPEAVLLAEAIRELLSDEEMAAHYRRAALERAGQLDIRTICAEWARVIEE